MSEQRSSLRVARGGGWGVTASFSRSSVRIRSGAGYRGSYLGFRGSYLGFRVKRGLR